MLEQKEDDSPALSRKRSAYLVQTKQKEEMTKSRAVGQENPTREQRKTKVGF